MCLTYSSLSHQLMLLMMTLQFPITATSVTAAVWITTQTRSFTSFQCYISLFRVHFTDLAIIRMNFYTYRYMYVYYYVRYDKSANIGITSKGRAGRSIQCSTRTGRCLFQEAAFQIRLIRQQKNYLMISVRSGRIWFGLSKLLRMRTRKNRGRTRVWQAYRKSKKYNQYIIYFLDNIHTPFSATHMLPYVLYCVLNCYCDSIVHIFWSQCHSFKSLVWEKDMDTDTWD